MIDSTPKSSIKIYKYKPEIQYTYSETQKKIKDETQHKYKIRMTREESHQRYVTYTFHKRETTEDILWYTIKSTRELPEETQTTYHDICISKKGYLVIAGLTDKETLLKYVANLLHPQRYNFNTRYFTKSEIQKTTDEILAEDSNNKIHSPRFHFFKKYKGREFSDFYISETESAEDDPEYSEMLEHCQYFEPIFKIQKINEHNFISDIKLNHRGLIYSSQKMLFEDWIKFMKKYFSWCI